MDELRKLIRALFPQADPRKFGQALQARPPPTSSTDPADRTITCDLHLTTCALVLASQSLRNYFEVGEDALHFESFCEGLQGAIELLGEDPATHLPVEPHWYGQKLASIRQNTSLRNYRLSKPGKRATAATAAKAKAPEEVSV